jgi:ATP-dependent Lhr-like helicase
MTLVFVNTRMQAEFVFQELWKRNESSLPIALHHGSLDKSVRDWVEAGLKVGTLKAVVATSSLDLGVDFLPVERVLQIGSAKGVARLLQRAGRSGHAPGRVSRVTLVPTHALELVEGKLAFAVVKGKLKMAHIDAIAGGNDDEPEPEAGEDAILLTTDGDEGDGRNWDDDQAPEPGAD